jgi:prophage antirepressor-like protein
MKEIIPFNYAGSPVRVIKDDHGEPWFVARDVATVLGYTNSRKAINDHCKGVTKRDLPTRGGLQSVTIIPERDLYQLIMNSRLPAAQRFEEWVVGTVLPSVRKHGGYLAGQENTDRQVVRQPCRTRDLALFGG